MTKEEKIAQLKQTIERAASQLAALEQPNFKICPLGHYVEVDGTVSGRVLPKAVWSKKAVKRARFFATAEIAVTVDKIIGPSYFIAQYVLHRVPGYKPDWNNQNEKKYFIYFGHNLGKFVKGYLYASEYPGVIFMPEHVADDLCEMINSGGYILHPEDVA